MRRLRTAREVVKALGGPEKVMLMAEATKQQFWNWESYFEAFPANTHWIMTKHLRKKKCVAPPHLWKQIGARGGKRAA